jgi:hypothetical protein
LSKTFFKKSFIKKKALYYFIEVFFLHFLCYCFPPRLSKSSCKAFHS